MMLARHFIHQRKIVLSSLHVWIVFLVAFSSFGQVTAAHAQNATPPATQAAQVTRNTVPAPLSGYTLPFVSLHGHGGVLVRVRLNNKIDANFLVDTGSAPNIITSRLVKALGLTAKPIPYLKSNVPLPPGTPIDMVVVDDINAGGFKGSGLECLVSDFTESLEDKTVDGVLGANILQLFAALFNFEANQLVLIPKGNLNDTQLAYVGITGGVGSGSLLKNQGGDFRFTVPVRIEVNQHTATMPLLVDTGAPNTVVLDPNNDLNLKKGQPGVAMTTRKITGLLTYYVFPVAAFGVGEKEPEAQRNNLAPFECGLSLDDGSLNMNSVLGLNYLSHFRVLLDYPAQRLYLTPVANPAHLPFPTASSRQSARQQVGDAVMAPSAEGKWTVIATQNTQSFGQASLLVGDMIETINGKKTDGLLLFGISSLLHQSLEADDFQVLRDGKSIKITVKK